MTGWEWNAEVAAALAARFQGWTDCNSTGDMQRLPSFLHDDFLYVSVFGVRLDRTGYLDLAGRLDPGGFYVIHRAQARVRGDVAELDGEYYTHSILGDDDLSAHTRFTATWVREGPEWVCLTHHGTLYEPNQALADEMALRAAQAVHRR
jgi:hypothetical protein